MMFLIASLLLFVLCNGDVSNSILNDVVIDNNSSPPPKHHKVHNLILNPDQDSWCELKKIRQIVTHAQCTSKEMENFVCVGTCFSYTVPQTEPETPGDEMLDYCDSCQAAESHWTTVSLDCENDGAEYQVTKNIQQITNCSCAACRSTRAPPQNNDILRPSEHRISELIYKMLPDSYPLAEDNEIILKEPSILDDHRYSQVSLGDLKEQFNLDPSQEKLLRGKLLMKDLASFVDDEEESLPLRV